MVDSVDGLIFSEFLADNPARGGFDTDGDGRANKSDEYIEFQNTTGEPVSLAGFEIWSDSLGQIHAFDDGDTIAPGDVVTVTGRYDGDAPDGFYDADRNSARNDGEGQDFLRDGEGDQFDTLYLVNTTTGEYVAFSYGDPPRPPDPPDGFPGTQQNGEGESLNSDAPNGVAFYRDENGEWVEGAPGTNNPGDPGVICFAHGTRILTPYGPRAVETLVRGDAVVTAGGAAHPIEWLARRDLGPGALARNPALRPVRLRRAWTRGAHDLWLSPQHCVLVSGLRGGQQLVRAGQLARLRGGAVHVAHGVRRVHYVHFMLRRHAIVFANGVAVDTFYPGPRAVDALAPAARLSLLARFPGQPGDRLAQAYGPPVARFARSRDLPDSLDRLRPVRYGAALSPALLAV